MPRHLFLTGDIQVGKSTAICKVLRTLNIPVGGFRTIAGNYTQDGSSEIYLVPAGTDAPILHPENRVAKRHGAGCRFGFSAFSEVFDDVGTNLLQNTQRYPLILMDELGFLEKDAYGFQKAVLTCLAGSVPVLGVVRDRDSPFLNKVRSHPNVEVLRVTKENRDLIYADLLERFSALKP